MECLQLTIFVYMPKFGLLVQFFDENDHKNVSSKQGVNIFRSVWEVWEEQRSESIEWG